MYEGRPFGDVVNMQDYDIVVSEFKLHWRYYVYFQINTLGKGMNTFILTRAIV